MDILEDEIRQMDDHPCCGELDEIDACICGVLEP
jgi:hypothetical protein